MNYHDVDPSIKRLFPWALFLVLAGLFAIGAIALAHAEEDVYACYGPARYVAMSAAWPACAEICAATREYLKTHTIEEGRAEARTKHIPEWIIKKAERCLHE